MRRLGWVGATRLGTALALAAAVPGQVIPDGLAGTEGDSAAPVPARHAPSRVQCAYHASVLGGLAGGTLATVGLRPDGTAPVLAPRHVLLTNLWFSEGGAPAPDALDPHSYRANQVRARAWKQVLTDRQVDYPAVPPPGGGPAAFVTLPLDLAFAYTTGTHLLLQWDSRTLTGARGAWDWDADAQTFRAGGTAARFAAHGTACPAGAAFGGFGASGWPGGSIAWFFDSGAAAGLLGAGVVGLSERRWNGVPLPIDLGALGAPGCHAWIEQLLVAGYARAEGGSGRATITVALPPLRRLAGLRVLTQTLVLDAAHNPLGVRTSPWGSFVLGEPPIPLGAAMLFTGSSGSGGVIGDRPEASRPEGLVLTLR